jgi:hypothetical protein
MASAPPTTMAKSVSISESSQGNFMRSQVSMANYKIGGRPK